MWEKAFLQNGSQRKIFLLLLIDLVKKGRHLEVFKQLWFFFRKLTEKKIIISPKYQNTHSMPLTQLNITF